jgi:heterodisulfide reductase subunit A
MSLKRIGVFICYCGGNISDSVDVEKVREAVSTEAGVALAKTSMFTCSDATQQEIIDDVRNEKLDGLVVASCSPKLHLHTFRSVAERSGLNPYQYVQVNLREQCSWVHRTEREQATEKAIHLVRGGIARCLQSEALSSLRIETTPKALVIGGGVAGLRSAAALSDLGLHVYLIEKEAYVGGWTGRWGKMFPHNRSGREIIGSLKEEIRKRENITVFTDAELMEKSGSVGNFNVKIQIHGRDEIQVNVGAILVTTGFEIYQPAPGEFGYGEDGVLLLPEFRELVDNSSGALLHNGRAVRNIVYIYCVGSRQNPDEGGQNLYCSRYCCSTAVHTALCAQNSDSDLRQYHIYRDMRTYGQYELLYEEACSKGSAFLCYTPDKPPLVERANGNLHVTVHDQLIAGENVEIAADIVVLVTGMVPRKNAKLVDVLKLPVSKDGFFNEIHPKLRPVETVVDGIYIAGAAQGPKNIPESVASALSAVSKSAGLLMKGYVDLDPFVAVVDSNLCTWCGECLAACQYGAVEKIPFEGREIARIDGNLCKGGGACLPVCPENAIDLKGYTDTQIKAVIEALA